MYVLTAEPESDRIQMISKATLCKKWHAFVLKNAASGSVMIAESVTAASPCTIPDA